MQRTIGSGRARDVYDTDHNQISNGEERRWANGGDQTERKTRKWTQPAKAVPRSIVSGLACAPAWAPIAPLSMLAVPRRITLLRSTS